MNVVLLTVDCLRADRVGFMGYDGGTTPFLNELAEDGVVFEKAFATGPTTTQSMPGLMTGTYPSWFGGYPPIPESQQTLAEAFSDAGFTTVGIHSNPWLHPSHRFDTGFDEYIDITEEERQGSRPEPKQGTTVSNRFSARAKGRFFKTLKSAYYELPEIARRAVSQSYFTYYYLFDRARDKAELAVDRAIDQLEKHGTDNVFLWIHFMDVHRPYTLPAASIGDGIWQNARITRPAYTNPTPRDQKHISQVYDRSVAYVDGEIERLYKTFEERNADEETLFAITADHGEEFGEHGDWFHRNFKLVDELLHVPLLIVPPDSTNRRVDSLVSLIDVASTLTDWANLPSNLDGVSLLPLMGGESASVREAVIGEIFDPERDIVAIRTEQLKFIRDSVSECAKLYDMERGEQQISVFEFGDTPEEMRAPLRRYMERRETSSDQQINSSMEDRLRDLGYLE